MNNYAKYFMSVALCTVIASSCGIAARAQYQDISASPSVTAPQESAKKKEGSKSLFFNTAFKAEMGRGLEDNGKFLDAVAMQMFYEDRHFKPLWTAAWGKHREAEKALQVFEAAWTHGLNPGDYHAEEIRSLLDTGFGARQARLELLVTDAATRYLRDMSGMRVRASDLRLNGRYWRQMPAAEEVLTHLAQSRNPAKLLAETAPAGELYRRLQTELLRLTKEASEHDHLLPMSFGRSHFSPGQKHADVAKLRARLDVEFDSRRGPENFYDDELAAAVMKFQSQHGLEPDGVIGEMTLKKLNQTNRDRIEQIVANMERLRWLHPEFPDRYVLVNIGSQRLWAMENGREVLSMDVVVGMPTRQTKMFSSEIRGIRFNPQWNVPMGIKMRDFLPKLKEDPNYLAQKGIHAIRGHGRDAETLDPTAVDWSSMGAKEMSKIRLVQPSGDNNALGQVRVLMDNEYDIYMHDTNHPEFFEKTQRTYSSGCIRLSEPEKLAMFILSRNDGWNEDKMNELIDAGRTVEVPTEQRLPVYIVYQTMWLDDDGRLVYGTDVYGQDRKLAEILRGSRGIYIPAGDEPQVADAAKPSRASRGAGAGTSETTRALNP